MLVDDDLTTVLRRTAPHAPCVVLSCKILNVRSAEPPSGGSDTSQYCEPLSAADDDVLKQLCPWIRPFSGKCSATRAVTMRSAFSW